MTINATRVATLYIYIYVSGLRNMRISERRGKMKQAPHTAERRENKKTKVENGVRKVCVYGDLLDFPFIYLRDTSHNFVVVYKYISRAFRCLS